MRYILLLQNLREATAGVLDEFMLQVTTLGQPLITFLLLAFVYWCIEKRTGQLMAFNISFACWLNQWVKRVFKVERPWIKDERIAPVEEALKEAGGYSMPSGHTTRAMATWGAVGVSAWKKVRWASIFCWGIVAAVMFSRNYLGVHTFADVAVAFILGGIILGASDCVLNWVEKEGKEKRDILVCVIGCIFIFMPMLRFGCLSNAGAAFGFMIGWVLERRFVAFEMPGGLAQKAIRFFPGAAVVFLCFTSGTDIVAHIVPEKYAGFFLQGFASFFIMFFYPLMFHVWESEKLDKTVKRKLKCWISLFLVVVLVMLMGVGVHRTINNYKNMGLNDMASVGTEADIQETQTEVPEDKTRTDVKVIAHRGYSSIAPENTLASFERAVDIGADMIELDVQMTKDGVLVVFHDTDMVRITGQSGVISDYTYAEIGEMDAGSWFSDSFTGEKIPTLAEVLELLQDSEIDIYLELKDIGEVQGFAEAVVQEVMNYQMQDRVVFASFNYSYLKTIKELDGTLPVLCNTQLGDANRLLADYPAEYYGLYIETIQQDTIAKLKQAGSKVYVYTANKPSQMRYVIALGADGIVTNYPGTAKILIHDEYRYLADHYVDSITVPVLYDYNLQDSYQNYVLQGFTKIGNTLVTSAYDYNGEKNSVLYLMDLNGNLIRIVDIGIQAHVGGISYDETHDLLWVTGADGMVNAISWSAVQSGSYQGEIQISFDVNLVNQDGNKVASFLTIDEGRLYVGSYTEDEPGELHVYDITDASAPAFISTVQIPERIQGITFSNNVQTGERTMILSQGSQTEEGELLSFTWDETKEAYLEAKSSYMLPEGVEQIQMTASGLYMVFESAASSYREVVKCANDQIWLLRYE